MQEMKPSPQIVVAFKAPSDLVARLDALANREGLTRASAARRLMMLQLASADRAETAA